MVLKLPLTQAILPSLMAEAEGKLFALPLESVAEVVEVDPNRAATIGGRPAVLLRGRVLPIVTLDAVFNRISLPAWRSTIACPEDRHSCLSQNAPTKQDRQECLSSGGAKRLLVVLGPPEGQMGLAVDRVLGEENVVVKSLAANYRHIPGVAGAGISGEGRVFLILDPPAALENAEERER